MHSCAMPGFVPSSPGVVVFHPCCPGTRECCWHGSAGSHGKVTAVPPSFGLTAGFAWRFISFLVAAGVTYNKANSVPESALNLCAVFTEMARRVWAGITNGKHSWDRERHIARCILTPPWQVSTGGSLNFPFFSWGAFPRPGMNGHGLPCSFQLRSPSQRGWLLQSGARLRQCLAACKPSAAAPSLSVILGGLFGKPGWMSLALGRRRHPLQL